MQIEIGISVGELIDKITILEIKKSNIRDPKKLQNVETELRLLLDIAHKNKLRLDDPTVKKLSAVNLKLWHIEDEIREKERQKQFDQEFIELARSVYIRNDERFTLKHSLNLSYKSALVEEKSYKDYQ